MRIKEILFLSVLSAAAVFATDYPVTSTNDSGSGTLREALGLIEVGDTITFDPELSGTITLASDLPSIVIDTTITGPTTGSVTIDGASSYTIFDVNSWTTISNLHLTNHITSVSGGAVLVGSDGTLLLDTVSIPHCNSCEPPVLVLENATLMTNNVTFSSSGTGGVDVLFEEGTAAIFASTSPVQPQVWVGTSGLVTLYKEGAGVLELKASSSVNLNLVADEGTLLFSDTTAETVIALSNGIFQGTPSVDYLANGGVVQMGDSFGTITAAEGYSQDSGGDLVVKINASGSTDLLESPDRGLLSGDLIIQLAPGTYTASSTYTLLACDGGFDADFDNVYFDIPGEGLQSLSNASLNYNTDTIVLEITSTFVVDPPESASALEDHEHHKKDASPVSRLFKQIMEHKRQPKENVHELLLNYQKHLEKKFRH